MPGAWPTPPIPPIPPKSSSPVRVLICDDSGVVRGVLARLLGADAGLRVVAQAANGRDALAAMDGLPAGERPHVVLLDLEMPIMDGMTALPLLLRRPDPPAVIVASALTQRGAAAAMAALRAGAVDYVPKPGSTGGGVAGDAFREELLAKLRGWARVGRTAPAAPAIFSSKPGYGFGRPPVAIGIGSSTGGPQALARLVPRLRPAPPVPMVIVQHMPRGFTAMLADHLGRLGGPPVSEAVDGECLKPGHILVAPGERHLIVEARPNGALRARLTDTPPENFCRPAVDPMLRSLAAAAPGPVLAIILTGMGQDGLAGCRAVADAGGTIFAQDDGSSVVWGMPGAVTRAGLAKRTGPPELLADHLLAAFGSTARRTA